MCESGTYLEVWGGYLLLPGHRAFLLVTSQGPDWVYFYGSSLLVPPGRGVSHHIHQYSLSAFFSLFLQPVQVGYCSKGNALMIFAFSRPNPPRMTCIPVNQTVVLRPKISHPVHRMCRTNSVAFADDSKVTSIQPV